MKDAIRKTLLAGVGAALATKDKVESALGELVEQGKISTAEARTVAGRIARDGRREFDAASKDLGGKLNKALLRSTTEAQTRLRKIEKRLRKLEKKSPDAAKPRAKATRRKPRPRKPA